ncbi:hypothetical protein LCGC14_0248760 [marine sediment metagenome]|uniref:Uncharacterized protein n=1 Tax=marine sediment metagenome TaxID=412755 RepID=A0A0F9U9N8_9ZZZZ
MTNKQSVPREYVITRKETDLWSAQGPVYWHEKPIHIGRDREGAFKILAKERKRDTKRAEGKSLRYTLLNVYCDGDERYG